MQFTDIPTKIPIPFASSAGAGYINTVPQTPSATPGAASFQTGFPPLTFEQIAAGGDPPFGKDFNGILNAITQWLRWAQAGGVGLQYDSAFSASVGGYPKNALLLAATPGYGHFWLSTVDNNTTNPDSGGAGWAKFPDALIQLQQGNYAVDSSTTQNQIRLTLSRTPASLAELVGSPIRFVPAFTNTVNNPQLYIASASGWFTPATIVNADGSVLAIGQLIANGNSIADGFIRADGTFQLNNPVKPFSPAASWPPAGFIMPWATETAPSGFLECAGQTLLISSYPNLWAVLGTRYGGDGVNNFKLPDYRGEFLRGWDHGRALDPNAASRTNAGGGIVGDHVGTNEAGSVRSSDISGNITIYNPVISNPPPIGPGSQNLSYPLIGQMTPSGGGFPLSDYFGPWYDATQLTGTIAMAGGTGLETRPVNINVMWVIFTG